MACAWEGTGSEREGEREGLSIGCGDCVEIWAAVLVVVRTCGGDCVGGGGRGWTDCGLGLVGCGGDLVGFGKGLVDFRRGSVGSSSMGSVGSGVGFGRDCGVGCAGVSCEACFVGCGRS